MAGNGGSSKPGGNGKRRARPTPPTIELTATALPDEPPGQPAAEPAVEPVETQVAAPEPVPAAEEPRPDSQPAMDATEHAEPSEAVPSDSAETRRAGLKFADPIEEVAAEPREEPVTAQPKRDFSLPRPWLAVAAAAGAVGVAIVLVFALVGPWNSPAPPQPGESAALAARLAAVEAQLGELVRRPQPAPVAPSELAALGARLQAIESQLHDIVSRPDPAVAQATQAAAVSALAARLDTAEKVLGRIDEVAKRLGAVEQTGRRLDDIAAQIAKIEATLAAPRPSEADTAVLVRLAMVDTAVKSLLARLDELGKRLDAVAAAAREADRHAAAASEAAAQRVATAGADPVVRLAFLAGTLRAAVERGEPFAAELAALKPLAADKAALAPLEPFAASGVPSAAALARELSALVPALAAAAAPPSADGSFLDRLRDSTRHLVRIRRVGEAPGDDAAAVVARIEVKAVRGDVAGALAEFAKLQPSVRAPAEAWIKKATQRVAALDAAQRLAADAVAALAKPAP